MTKAWEITAPLLDLIRAELAMGRTSVARLAQISGVSRGTIYATFSTPSEGGSLGVLCRLADAIGATVTLVVTPGVGLAHATRKRRVTTALIAHDALGGAVGNGDVAPHTDAGPPPNEPSAMDGALPAGAVQPSGDAPLSDAAHPIEALPALQETALLLDALHHAPTSVRRHKPKKLKRYRPNLERWRSDGVMRQAWARRPGNVLAISKSLRMNSWACRRRFLVMGLIEPRSEQEVERTAHYRAMAQARCSGCSIREVARRTNVSLRVADQTLRMLSISGRTRTVPPTVVHAAEMPHVDRDVTADMDPHSGVAPVPAPEPSLVTESRLPSLTSPISPEQ